MDNNERGEITSAAVHLFQENGYQNTTVDEIVKRVNKTKYAFYHLFSDKEEILYVIHEQIMNDLLTKAEHIAKSNISVEEKLSHLISDIMHNMQYYRSYVTVYLTESRSLKGKRLAEVMEKRNHYFQLVYDVVVNGASSGKLRTDIDPKVLTLALLGMCNWMYTWFSPEGKYQASQIGEMFYKLFLYGALDTNHATSEDVFRTIQKR